MRGVVIFASPHAHLLTFEARRPGEQFLQLGEPARTAAVLGRARALAGHALWVYRGRVGRRAGLDGNLVFPAVAEVVLVTGQVLWVPETRATWADSLRNAVAWSGAWRRPEVG